MQDTVSRQCDYCGKIFECHTSTLDGAAITNHIKKCKLEKASCNCGLTFNTPREKRAHMLVKHSDQGYMQCAQCMFTTKAQKAMDSHVEYFHGFPGREEVICLTTFFDNLFFIVRVRLHCSLSHELFLAHFFHNWVRHTD